jgi:hypothetical protein
MMIDNDILYSSQGHKRTRALFWETALPDDHPVMTLNRKEGYIAIRPLFIELVVDDPSEAIFAETVFGDVAFWENITKAKWMAPYLREWRMICDVKRKSYAFQAVVKEVKEGGRSSFTAAKYLIEEPWNKDKKTKTTTAKIASQGSVSTDVLEDAERLFKQGFLK